MRRTRTVKEQQQKKKEILKIYSSYRARAALIVVVGGGGGGGRPSAIYRVSPERRRSGTLQNPLHYGSNGSQIPKLDRQHTTNLKFVHYYIYNNNNNNNLNL